MYLIFLNEFNLKRAIKTADAKRIKSLSLSDIKNYTGNLRVTYKQDGVTKLVTPPAVKFL